MSDEITREQVQEWLAEKPTPGDGFPTRMALALLAAWDERDKAQLAADAAASLLLDVQQDCIAQRKRAERYEREAKAARKLLMGCGTAYDPETTLLGDDAEESYERARAANEAAEKE